jgi:hypothetical protein
MLLCNPIVELQWIDQRSRARADTHHNHSRSSRNCVILLASTFFIKKPHAIQSKNNQAIHFRILLHGRTTEHKSRSPILLALRD